MRRFPGSGDFQEQMCAVELLLVIIADKLSLPDTFQLKSVPFSPDRTD